MRLAPDVKPFQLEPGLLTWLLVLDLDHRQATGDELVVTSLWRPRRERPSLHAPGDGELVRAADLRRWSLDAAGAALWWCGRLRAWYGPWLGVVLEPEELTEEQLAERGGRDAVQPHVHVQLKPGEGALP